MELQVILLYFQQSHQQVVEVVEAHHHLVQVFQVDLVEVEQ
jgi:hypothetical protein